jgi:hypothetical protein
MSFGDRLKEDGWTIVTLSTDKAIQFSFTKDSDIVAWLNETVPVNEWERVSFRSIAFRYMSAAILFKLSCC